MRILRLRAYYYPEKTASNAMSDNMDELYEQHRIVNVNITPIPTRGISDEVRKEYKKKSYEEQKNGSVVIKRFPMFKERRNPLQRAFRYFCCCIAEYNIGIRQTYIDIVHCGSTPPIQGLLGGMVAKRLSKKYKHKVPFVYNLQDIFPDSMVNAGLTKKGSIVWKIGRWVENKTYSYADKIIVISDEFKNNLLNKSVSAEKIEIVPNWIDTDQIKPVSRIENKLFDEFGISRDKFIVLYAGNLGEAQGADIIIEAAKNLADNQSILFVVFGGGSRYEEFIKKSEVLNNVIVFPMQPQSRVSEVYSLGDIALITCKKGMGSSAIPSKTWTIMACNVPMLAAFDGDSELVKMITDNHFGVSCPPEDAEKLSSCILYMQNESSGTYINEREYVVASYDKRSCTTKYLNALLSCKELIGNE